MLAVTPVGRNGMLKIVLDATPSGVLVLRLEGRVIGPWVEVLRRACERALAGPSGLTLDLAEVSFVDQDGAELLESFSIRRVALINSSPFVAEQLRAWARSAADGTVEGRR